MASTYPTSLDAFTNPTTTNSLTSPSHASQHADINDAVEALETKVAIGNTVLGTYTAYTPTIGGFTLGDGTMTASYCQVNKLVHTYGKIVWGTTSAFTAGNATLTFPINPILGSSSPFTFSAVGTSSIADVSVGTAYFGIATVAGLGTNFFLATQGDAR